MGETVDPLGDTPPNDPHPSDEQLSESDWEAIDTAVIRLEDAWKKGQPPDISTFVSSDARPALQGRVLVQLVAVDMEWRWRTAGTGLQPRDEGAAADEDETVGYQPPPLPFCLVGHNWRITPPATLAWPRRAVSRRSDGRRVLCPASIWRSASARRIPGEVRPLPS